MGETAFDFAIDTERNLVTLALRGQMSGQEVMLAVRNVWAHPDFRPEMLSLIDLRELQAVAETADIVKIAHFFKRQSQGVQWGKVAVVVSAVLSYGSTRMFGAYADSTGIELGVFYELDEAMSWLGFEN